VVQAGQKRLKVLLAVGYSCTAISFLYKFRASHLRNAPGFQPTIGSRIKLKFHPGFSAQHSGVIERVPADLTLVAVRGRSCG
jgi:hypothetical protein